MRGKIVQVEYAVGPGCLFVVTDLGELWSYNLQDETWTRIK